MSSLVEEPNNVLASDAFIDNSEKEDSAKSSDDTDGTPFSQEKRNVDSGTESRKKRFRRNLDYCEYQSGVWYKLWYYKKYINYFN